MQTCTSANAVNIVRRECSAKTSCSVRATNTVFSDPCVGTFKYLEVRYICGRNVVPITPGFFDAVIKNNVDNLK